MQLPIVQAAADEAHRKGKLVFAHPSTIEGVGACSSRPCGRARSRN